MHALREFVSLAPLTTLGVGGSARYFVEIADEPALESALGWAETRALPVRILGGGSNVVIGDGDFEGLVLRLATRGIEFSSAGSDVLLRARAGESWDNVVERAVALGHQGLECLSGIPGSLGATPIQNVGAYGQEVAETLVGVRAFDRKTRAPRELSARECRFAYRDSLFKSEEPERFVLLEATFRLKPGGRPALRYAELERHFAGSAAPSVAEVRNGVIALRRAKSMVWDPSDENGRSCGSFFTNPIVSPERAGAVQAAAGVTDMPRYPQSDGRVKLAAGWLIERAGFAKGTRHGAVGLSTRHALSIVCHDGARAADVLDFARSIQARVRERFQVELLPEPVFWT
ncbi:MAG TPA: UDP-N-acetylmuramate dehydrogenase [Polyangiaceae bacterium]